MNHGGARPRLIDGRFELLERLGGGGMGLVWRARDTALDREVALKEVRPPDQSLVPEESPEAAQIRERVLREARALARLQHPNVVIIHHIVDDPAYVYPWLVMELVRGGSLADLLERGPLPAAHTASIGRGVLAALCAAHAAGIHHRDVKPGNVLLRADGTPVLTDFGIAALHDATALTATGSLIGSPEFIAPERIRGQEGDPRSDLWSLGMMLYVAVEGHHPLRRSSTLATLAAVLDEPLPPPQRAGRLGPVLSAVLARDPAARPGPAELDRMLADAARSEPGTAPGSPSGHSRPGQDPAAPDAVPHTLRDAVQAPPPGFGPWDPGQWTPAPPEYARGTGAPTPHPTYNDAVPGHPHTPAPTPLPVPTPAPAAPPARRARAVVPALAAAVVVLAGALVWTQLAGGGHHGTAAKGTSAGPLTTPSLAVHTAPAPSTPAAATPTPADTGAPGTGTGGRGLLTPAGMRTLVKALTPHTKGGEIKSLVVYPDYAVADIPAPDDPTGYVEWNYRDGQLTSDDDFDGSMDGDKPVPLGEYDWDALPGLLSKARTSLNVPDADGVYLIVEPDLFSGVPRMSVYRSNKFGSGYLLADPNGTVVRTDKRS